MRAGPEEDPVAEDPGSRGPGRRDRPADDAGHRQHRMPPPPPPRPARERHNRPDAASALPPPPYRAAPPPSTPFNDPGPVSSLPPVPPPQPRTAPAAAPAGGAQPLGARRADDTQVMTSLPPVPRGPVDEREEEIEAREGAPGASRGILRAAGTMAVATLVSRVTGLLRTIVLAAALGVRLVNDAYTTANTLPNIVYELLLGGVLTSVIVPLLVHAQERDRDGGMGYAQRLATIATAGLRWSPPWRSWSRRC